MLEFFKQPGVYETTLFFSGIIVYRILSLAFAINHMAKYYREVGVSAFNIILMSYLMALTALEQKEKIMNESQIDEKIIKNVLEEDKKEIEAWRDMCLKALYDFAPKIFKTIKEDFDKEGELKWNLHTLRIRTSEI